MDEQKKDPKRQEPPKAAEAAKPGAMPPVDMGYTRRRIAERDARKEAARKGSSKPMRAS